VSEKTAVFRDQHKRNVMETIKHFINAFTNPKILFPVVLISTFLLFPANDFLLSLNRRLRLYKLWTNKGAIAMFSFLFLFFVFGVTDENFRKIVTKPDNVPIVGLLFLVVFFLWLAMKQATENDERIAKGLKSNEAEDAKEKILVWPDLVFIELIAIIGCLILLTVWAMSLQAPIEEPANPTVSPNPSKAPWYFLGLQEMLVYFDPWLAGVVFPGIIVLGFMCIPFIDNNRRGSGYYTFVERKMAISIFMFLWLCLWIFLISTGTFLRGPNWNFFGPFEYWDIHKLEALTNINLSEYIYMIGLKRELPHNIFFREMWGFLVVMFYLGALPFILSKTLFKTLYNRLGTLRYTIFTILLLLSFSLPIKMFLRWAFNIKYIIAIPEFFFNI
jgi:hypothetical protein